MLTNRGFNKAESVAFFNVKKLTYEPAMRFWTRYLLHDGQELFFPKFFPLPDLCATPVEHAFWLQVSKSTWKKCDSC